MQFYVENWRQEERLSGMSISAPSVLAGENRRGLPSAFSASSEQEALLLSVPLTLELERSFMLHVQPGATGI